MSDGTPSEVSVGDVADQVMRRMLNVVDRAAAACLADASALRELEVSRREDLSRTEKEARTEADRVSFTNVAASWRQELLGLPLAKRPVTPIGEPPATFEDLVQEWNTLMPSASLRMRELRDEHERWSARIFKRKSSAPPIPESLWADLERLSLLYEHAKILRDAMIAQRVRERTEASAVVIAAESERRRAAQDALFEDARRVVSTATAVMPASAAPWDDPLWTVARPASELERVLRLGDLDIALPDLAQLKAIPALVAFPFTSGFVLESGVEDRANAVACEPGSDYADTGLCPSRSCQLHCPGSGFNRAVGRGVQASERIRLVSDGRQDMDIGARHRGAP